MTTVILSEAIRSLDNLLGLPLGSDKSKWIKKVKMSDVSWVRRFTYVFRFIDVIVFCDGGESEWSFKEICPPEIAL